MRHLFAAGALLSILAFSSSALATSYGWTISASSTDPYDNSAPFLAGLTTSYVWYACSTPLPAGAGGVAAAEFSICSSNPSNLILAVTAQNGFLNAATNPDVLLAVGGCPTGPLVAATVLMLNQAPGQLCLCISTINGINGAVDCTALPQIHPIEWIGLDMGTGQEPCSDGEAVCQKPISVEEASWGQIKGLYR